MIDLTKYEADAPTPGQSLTTEPGNRPWETPPRYNEPVEVLGFYADKLLQPELTKEEDNALETLEQEKIEAYLASVPSEDTFGLMSKPIDVATVAEEEEEE